MCVDALKAAITEVERAFCFLETYAACWIICTPSKLINKEVSQVKYKLRLFLLNSKVLLCKLKATLLLAKWKESRLLNKHFNRTEGLCNCQ